MTRLRKMPAVYATFRMNPRTRAKPRANSSAPIVVTKKPGFALTVWLQKPNHGCSQLGYPWPATAVVCGGVRTRGPLGSGVHVPVELVRRGPQRRLQVLVELQLLVLLEEVLREDRLQEHVIRLQVLDRFLQGAGQLADAVLLALARTQMVQVLVDRVAGVDLPLDAV